MPRSPNFMQRDRDGILKKNFDVLREFFVSMGRRDIVSTINDLEKKPDGIYTAYLCANLASELAQWQQNLIFKCVSCDERVDVCPCQRFPSYSHPTQSHL